MQIERTVDTTSPEYWLNWRVLPCSLWVLASIAIALYLIWRYEGKDRSRFEGEASEIDICWKPCVKDIHPGWLLGYRTIAFCFLLATLIVKVNVNGRRIYYYYTQWTLTLVTINFAFGTLLSIFGCYHYYKVSVRDKNDPEHCPYVPLTDGESANTERIRKYPDTGNRKDVSEAAGILSYLFQVIYQTSAGAVMFTDCIYWIIIFPYYTIQDYSFGFLTVNLHTTNAILLLGEAGLNRLPVPWFRISYFLLWTGIFVIFQWTIHAFMSTWWPYPFLDLSSPYAPLWYLVMGLMHIPCYGIFSLFVKYKNDLLSKWFPQSFEHW